MQTPATQTIAKPPPGHVEANIQVRRAVAGDAPDLHAMLMALARYQNEEHLSTVTEADLLRDGFGPDPAFEALIAAMGGKPVGMAIFHDTYATWIGARGLFIGALFVDEKVRGAGVGYRLVRDVTRLARRRDRAHVQLNVIHANPARHFYDRMGFVHMDDLLTYRLNDSAFASLADDDARRPADAARE